MKGVRGAGVRVDANGELKFSWKLKNGGGVGSGGGGGAGLGSRWCQGGCDGELKFL